MAKSINLPEYNELKSIVESRDELHFTVASYDLFDAVKDSTEIKQEKKLVIYDLISKMSNCHGNERLKYLKKISKYLK